MKSGLAVSAEGEAEPRAAEAARLTICDPVAHHLGHDFSGYRSQTFLRRVERRMQVVNAATPARLRRETRSATPTKSASLFRDLLIRVTSFFRDQETFEVLGRQGHPAAVRGQDGRWRGACLGAGMRHRARKPTRWRSCCASTWTGCPPRPKCSCSRPTSTTPQSRRRDWAAIRATLLEGLSQSRRERFFSLSHGSYVRDQGDSRSVHVFQCTTWCAIRPSR